VYNAPKLNNGKTGETKSNRYQDFEFIAVFLENI